MSAAGDDCRFHLLLPCVSSVQLSSLMETFGGILQSLSFAPWCFPCCMARKEQWLVGNPRDVEGFGALQP
jgi:hypothetical protein